MAHNQTIAERAECRQQYDRLMVEEGDTWSVMLLDIHDGESTRKGTEHIDHDDAAQLSRVQS